ncbi:hypothetical protein RRG08_006327 [Elysia crispata]|uniref:Uncharacterized protein n=1 Tax=Elysia crispata TaxID=231223 RepID=A0AAE0YQ63_9GAST|nr:hypothetical protein RRG08_006327 [Elysia crispata]
MDIKTSLGNNIINHYSNEGVVCPPQLRTGEFVVGAADNIDHNPSSTTSTGSFHGTGISLFQNCAVTLPNPREQRLWETFQIEKQVKEIRALPSSFTEVKPLLAPTNMTAPAGLSEDTQRNPMLLTSVVREEKEWLDHVSNHLTQEINKEFALSWAAFHASKYQNSMLPSVNSMLPLFRDEASSFAMLRHCLVVVQAAIHHVNPGQTPVICVDQPLFAKLKQIQWSDETYSEDNFVILFGGFHIEMTALKVLGNLLQGSGWTEMVSKANISSAGTADSFLTASHVTRTRNAHQITACALHILMTQAFSEAKETDPDIDPGIDFDALQKEKSPQFLFWTTCLDLQLLVFSFVRAIRTANFELYVSALNKLVPWFFTFNHTHYARWISVHLRDMMILSEKHPDVYQQFKLGKFVVAKSKNNFSLISVDQGHEQNNAVLKDDGGIIGLTQDSDALVKWTISGPETVRVIAEFEKSIVGKSNTIKDTSPHHQETKSAQIRFAKQVTSMVDAILNAGNPSQVVNVR